MAAPAGGFEPYNPKILRNQLKLAETQDFFTCKICKTRLNRSQFSKYFLVCTEAERRCVQCTAEARKRAARLCFRTMPRPDESYDVFDALR